MYCQWEILLLVTIYVFNVYGDVPTESIGEVTTSTPEVESRTFRTKDKEDMLEKALIAKRRKKGKFDRFNLRYLHKGGQQGDRRGSYRHREKDFLRDRQYLGRKVKKHRTLLPPPKERKPNIILILTDDQDVELGSLNFMPHTLSLLRDGGAEFRHAYVTTPMCCPSRSSLLTGMYVHNHNVFTNNENCSSHTWQRTHETRSFATYLSNAGYRTGFFGKYLNKYNGSYVPPGWREWGGLIMNSRYYNYSINLNGRKVRHGDDYHRDYYTDLIANDSVSFLRQSKQYFSRKPVMLVLSFPAPHGPEDSAPQFSKMFFNVTTHHTPAYDYAPNPDKQWILQVTKKMGTIHKQFTDLLMTKRLQTLQSVDLAVQRIYQELKNIGELDNTYIVYTSDHGYHLGQFGLVKGKSFPFEFDVRVPFIVRGPGVHPGTVVDDIVLNIDLAPTFLDMAGVEPPPHMDGRSILKLLHPPRGARRTRWPDTFLIESSGRRDVLEQRPKFSGNNSDNNTGGFGNATESDIGSGGGGYDSGESENDDDTRHLDDPIPTAPNEDLAQDNKIPGVVPKPSLMSEECKRAEVQLPCRPGQKWFCVHDGARWRRHKCRPHICSCFTQQGYHYTRPVHPGDEIRSDNSLIHMLHSRRRREVSRDHISEIVDDLDSELEEAQDTEISLENATLWQCAITAQGKVHCSDTVYTDYQTWKQTRDKTEDKIRQLKSNLVALKELRKHLRDRKPHSHRHWNESHVLRPTIWTTLPPTTTEEEFMSTTEYTETTDYDFNTEISEITKETITERTETRLDNKIGPVRSEHDICFCSTSPTTGPQDEREIAREEKRRMREEKLRKKERKSRKKARMEVECLSEKMNCFNHDNDHWRTEPLWTEGPFCFCMNANNNTYSCLRTINATHNFLYCEFVTGLVTFYNIRIDPFEQLNRVGTLTIGERKQLSDQLADLKTCRGTKECSLGNHLKWQ